MGGGKGCHDICFLLIGGGGVSDNLEKLLTSSNNNSRTHFQNKYRLVIILTLSFQSCSWNAAFLGCHLDVEPQALEGNQGTFGVTQSYKNCTVLHIDWSLRGKSFNVL